MSATPQQMNRSYRSITLLGAVLAASSFGASAFCQTVSVYTERSSNVPGRHAKPKLARGKWRRAWATVFPDAIDSVFTSQTMSFIHTYTWTGTGNSNEWYDSQGPGCPGPNCDPNGNWDTPPDPNGILRFQGSNRTTNINNRFSNIVEIQFDSASNFFLSGFALDFLNYPTQRNEIRNDGTGTGSLGMNIVFKDVANPASEINSINGDIVLNGTVGFGPSTSVTHLEFNGNGHSVTFNGVISGGGKGLTLLGTNTVTLNASNTFTGPTAINAGTLNAAASGALEGTSSITVNNGGTLLVTTAGNLDRINNNAPITLGSATGAGTASFTRSGSGEVSEGSGAIRDGSVSGASIIGLGALTLQANSNFDFGTVGVGTFTLTTFVPNGHVLDILNWTSSANFGSLKSGVDGTDDRLIFSQDQAGNLAFITFNGTPAAQIPLDGSFVEIVPIPEAATWVVGLLIFGAMAVTQKRRLRALIF